MADQKNTEHSFYIPIHVSKSVNNSLKGNYNRNDYSATYDDVIIVSKMLDVRPLIMVIGMEFYNKVIITVAIVLSLFIGSYFKSIMYRYVFTSNKNNQGWMHRPINVLTISSAIINHISNVSIGLWVVALVLSDFTIGQSAGAHYCEVMDVVMSYGVSYLSVGSLGISIYRVLYIKHQHWVKFVVGEGRLLCIVLSLSITVSGIIVFLGTLETTNSRLLLNACDGVSYMYAQILIDYGLASGHQMITTTYLRKGAIALLIGIQLVELIIYIWFFYIRFKNDNGNIKRVLTVEAVRNRNIKNVSTFLSQFYSFLTEYAFLFAALVATCLVDTGYYFKAYIILAKFINFALLSAVEVFSSPSLRSLER